jgi:hypothetical protein
LALRSSRLGYARPSTDLDERACLQPRLVADEQGLVVDPEAQHELGRLDERGRVLEPWLSVHADDAERERVRLVERALVVAHRSWGRCRRRRWL